MNAVLVTGPRDGKYVTSYAVYEDSGLKGLLLSTDGETVFDVDVDNDTLDEVVDENTTGMKTCERVTVAGVGELKGMLGKTFDFE